MQALDERKNAIAAEAEAAFLGYASFNTWDSQDGGEAPALLIAPAHTRPVYTNHVNNLAERFKAGKLAFTAENALVVVVSPQHLERGSLVRNAKDLKPTTRVAWHEDAKHHYMSLFNGRHCMQANNVCVRYDADAVESGRLLVERDGEAVFGERVRLLEETLQSQKLFGVKFYDYGLPPPRPSYRTCGADGVLNRRHPGLTRSDSYRRVPRVQRLDGQTFDHEGAAVYTVRSIACASHRRRRTTFH